MQRADGLDRVRYWSRPPAGSNGRWAEHRYARRRRLTIAQHPHRVRWSNSRLTSYRLFRRPHHPAPGLPVVSGTRGGVLSIGAGWFEGTLSGALPHGPAYTRQHLRERFFHVGFHDPLDHASRDAERYLGPQCWLQIDRSWLLS